MYELTIVICTIVGNRCTQYKPNHLYFVQSACDDARRETLEASEELERIGLSIEAYCSSR